MVELSWG